MKNLIFKALQELSTLRYGLQDNGISYEDACKATQDIPKALNKLNQFNLLQEQLGELPIERLVKVFIEYENDVFPCPKKFRILTNEDAKKYEDIEELEEQLEIDLVTLFGLLDTTVYYIGKKMIDNKDVIKPMIVSYIDKGFLYEHNSDCEMTSLYINDFKKIWFLTKSEAQEALERRKK